MIKTSLDAFISLSYILVAGVVGEEQGRWCFLALKWCLSIELVQLAFLDFVNSWVRKT